MMRFSKTMTVKFISITPDAEKTIAYIARVSNPKNQDNEKFAGLLSIVSSTGIGVSLSKHI